MERYLSKINFERLERDFAFLIAAVRKSCGELDLRLRGNYFNLYYKGNSLAKVTFKKDYYEVSINRKFAKGVFNDDKRFKAASGTKDYSVFRISESKQLSAFLQRKNLNKLCSNIKKVNYGEEIVFEQMLITDNRNNPKFIIIDRQITETSLNKKRLDLLALRKIDNGKYGFLVIEVKLGNNKELKGDVVDQLQGYIDHIQSQNNFNQWKNCYEQVYIQMKELGLLQGPDHLEIDKDIQGIVLVGQYSGLAKEHIERLRKSHPEIQIKSLVNLL